MSLPHTCTQYCMQNKPIQQYWHVGMAMMVLAENESFQQVHTVTSFIARVSDVFQGRCLPAAGKNETRTLLQHVPGECYCDTGTVI